MSSPLVSVIMPTYNHAPFVEEAILSVLQQQGVDLELVVSDDGSSDETRHIVSAFRDSRIRFYPNEVNRGACTVTNELIGRCRGQYVAVINSDDAWMPGKLAGQVALLQSQPHVAATFGRAKFVGRDGEPVDKNSLPFGGIFDQRNRSSGQWLRRFFSEGNCLCHPTVLIRREVYDRLGRYSNRLRQLPDFDMWIRVVKKYSIHVAEDELIRFRILPGENASSPTSTNATRTMNEHFLIGEHFFDDVSRERMIEGFGDILVYENIPTATHLRIEQALMYFHHNDHLWRPYGLLGLQRMRSVLESDEDRVILESDYGIGDGWFHEQMARVSVLMHQLPPPPTGLKAQVSSALHATWRKLRSN